MSKNLNLSDQQFMEGWYQFSSTQSGFIGDLLRLLRVRQKMSENQQRKEFGVDKSNFLRLQGMMLPRPHQFIKDARRIAETCQVSNINVFVNALLLARKLSQSNVSEQDSSLTIPKSQQAYQAAFDEDDSLETDSDDHDAE